MKYLVLGGMTIIVSYLIELFILNSYNSEYEGKKLSREDIIKFVKKLEVKVWLRISVVLLLNMYMTNRFLNIPMLFLYALIFIVLYYIAIIDFKTKYIDNKLFYLLIGIGVISLFIEQNVNLSNALITGGVTLIWNFYR